MIHIKRNRHLPVENNKKGLGYSSKKNADNNDPFESISGAGYPTGFPNTSLAQMPIILDLDPLLTNIGDLYGDKHFTTLYRDIYYHDAVAGSAVDLMSNLPFSEFTIGGISDKKILKVYKEGLERLNIRTLLPEMSIDYLVTGTFLASLIYNKTEKKFIDIMPHGLENADITPLPFYSQDPIIDVSFPDSVKKALSRDSKRIKSLRQKLGEHVIKKLSSGRLELDPISTLYVPRRAFATTEGVSYFKRILPIYFIEKNLFRGTLMESAKRQRGILHLMLGDGDQWEPTVEDMEFITDLFMNADADPLGAIIATRMGVSVSELRCLSGDTLISTDNGIIRLDSIVDHQTDGIPQTFNVDLKVKDYSGEFTDVDQWHYQGNKPVYEITTESGTTIKCTDNHKFLILSDDGRLVMRRLKNIEEHDYLLTKTGGDTVTSKLPLGLTMPDIEIGSQAQNKNIKLPNYMTPDLAYLLALIISEGFYYEKTTTIVNTDLNLLNDIASYFKIIFGLQSTIRMTHDVGEISSYHGYTRTKKCYALTVNSSYLSNILTQLGLISVDAAKLINSDNRPCYSYIVPWSILQADRESKLAFIAGYIDGDGSVVVDKSSSSNAVEIKFFSRSDNILHALKIMLADLGFHSLIVVDKDNYRLNVQSSEACRLYNTIKKYIRSEHKKPFEFCDVLRRRKFGIPPDVFMPILNDRFIRRGKGGNWFENDDGNPVFVPGSFKYTFRHYEHANSYLLYDTLDDGGYNEELDLIYSVSQRLYKRIIQLHEFRFNFEKIVFKIAVGEKPVYDLSIKGNENKTPLFLANNIVTHNSGGEFWKISDIWDSTSSMKLRALGISEAFLCFSGDTLVSTEKGLVRLDSFYDYRSMKKDQSLPLNIKIKGKDGKIVDTSRWIYRGKSYVNKVVTNNGYNLKATDDHKILVLEGLDFKWKKVKDLKIGNRLCLDLNLSNVERKNSLKLNLKTIDILENDHSSKKVLTPQYMTPELAYTLGIIVSEGGITRKGSIVSNTKISVINKYEDGFYSIFGIKPTYKVINNIGKTFSINGVETQFNKVCYVSETWSVRACNLIRQLGILYNSEINKHKVSKGPSHKREIPWSILQADDESKYSFIAAYIDGDGTVNKKENNSRVSVEINIFSASYKLLKQMQIMLSDLGISSKLPKRGRRLSIKNSDATKLYLKIEKYLQHPDKKIKINNYPGARTRGLPAKPIVDFLNKRHIRREINVGEWFRNDENELVLIERWGQISSNAIGRLIKPKDGILVYDSYKNGQYDEFLNAVKQISDKLYNKLIHLLSVGYTYESVTSITRLKNKVDLFDLSIEKSSEPAFIANGLVVHNSGEATFSTMETSLTVFLEMLRAYRDMITRKVFYNKIFPLMSLINGFTVTTSGKVVRRENLLHEDIEDNLTVLQDGSRLLIPTIHWSKQLKPEGDATYMEMLDRMAEKGVPVPIRALVAAGGFNLDEVLSQQDDDLAIRKKLFEYQKLIDDLKKEYAPEGGGGEEGMEGFSSSMNEDLDNLNENIYKKLASDDPTGLTRSSVLSKGKKPSLFEREFGDSGEIKGKTKTGKDKAIYNQKTAQEKANENILKALKSIVSRYDSQLNASTATARQPSNRQKNIENDFEL